MPYLVHAADDRQRMLDAVGVRSMDDLLVDVPASIRSPVLDLPDGLSEQETMARVRELAGRNRVFEDRLCFRGGGVYRRFIPAAVSAVISKPEFYTAYTPYQPEASQGTLQAIFEFQTLIAELTDMDVANASLYDGATALAEAAMMAVVHTGRDKLVVAGYLHPEYVEVLRALWAGKPVTHEGALHKLRGAKMVFDQGRQYPIYIASTGSQMLKLAGEIADGVLLLVGFTPGIIDAVLTKPVRDQSLLDAFAQLFGSAGVQSKEPSVALQPPPRSPGRSLRILA